MITFARFLAWVYLVFSVIASIFILVNYSQTDESYTIISTYTRQVVSPVGIGSGIGCLFQGMVVFCLMMLTAKIAENTSKPLLATTETDGVIVEPKTVVPVLDGVSDIPVGQLHEAVWNGNYILAKKLILLGADIQAIRELDGKTPMDLAVERGDQLLINLLSS
jgi:hypothetical protein